MTPPRLAHWILGRVLPAGPEGDTIRGDLFEEYAARRSRSRTRASLWYWAATGQSLKSAADTLLLERLYGVHPADPLTFAGMSMVIAAVTLVSAYIPARRATRVDPAVVLRGD